MKRVLPCLLVLCGLVLSATCASAQAKLDWMEKVHDDGRHNAFTDLIRWNDAYYLCFRHAATHMSMDGEIRIMRSTDLKKWEACATLDTVCDDRDPHFVSDGKKLYCYFGVWDLVHMPNHALPDRSSVQSYFASTEDGGNWSKIQGVYEPKWWLWRVRYHDGYLYSAAYTAVRPKPDSRETRLVRSRDGLEWETVSVATTAHGAGEADLYFPAEGGVHLLSRTGDAPGNAFWFRADKEMKTWTETDTGVLVHSPAFCPWRGQFFVAGRGKNDKESVTRVWRTKGDTLEEVITLPSKGDTSYPGLLPDESAPDQTALFISWYSQHESAGDKGHASIYVGRIVVE